MFRCPYCGFQSSRLFQVCPRCHQPMPRAPHPGAAPVRPGFERETQAHPYVQRSGSASCPRGDRMHAKSLHDPQTRVFSRPEGGSQTVYGPQADPSKTVLGPQARRQNNTSQTVLGPGALPRNARGSVRQAREAARLAGWQSGGAGPDPYANAGMGAGYDYGAGEYANERGQSFYGQPAGFEQDFADYDEMPVQSASAEARHRKKTRAALISLCFVLAGSAAGVGFGLSFKPTKAYSEKMAEANRYFSDLDYARAEEYYLAAVEIDPKNPETYEKLYELYVAADEPEKAKEVVEKAKDQLPEQKQQQFANNVANVDDKYETSRDYTLISTLGPLDYAPIEMKTAPNGAKKEGWLISKNKSFYYLTPDGQTTALPVSAASSSPKPADAGTHSENYASDQNVPAANPQKKPDGSSAGGIAQSEEEKKRQEESQEKEQLQKQTIYALDEDGKLIVFAAEGLRPDAAGKPGKAVVLVKLKEEKDTEKKDDKQADQKKKEPSKEDKKAASASKAGKSGVKREEEPAVPAQESPVEPDDPQTSENPDVSDPDNENPGQSGLVEEDPAQTDPSGQNPSGGQKPGEDNPDDSDEEELPFEEVEKPQNKPDSSKPEEEDKDKEDPAKAKEEEELSKRKEAMTFKGQEYYIYLPETQKLLGPCAPEDIASFGVQLLQNQDLEPFDGLRKAQEVQGPFWIRENGKDKNGKSKKSCTLYSADGKKTIKDLDQVMVVSENVIGAFKDDLFTLYDASLNPLYSGRYAGGAKTVQNATPILIGREWKLVEFGTEAGQEKARDNSTK